MSDEGPVNRRAVSGNYHIDWINEVPSGYVGKPWLATPDSAVRFMDVVVADFVAVAKEVAAYRPRTDV